MIQQHAFRQGDRVDIVLRGVIVTIGGETELSFGVDGLNQELWSVPIADDDGKPLPAVTVTPALPEVCAGDVWRSRNGVLFFALVLHESGKQPALRLLTADDQPHTVEQVVHQYGPLDLVVTENAGSLEGARNRVAMFDLPEPEMIEGTLVDDRAASAGELEPPVYRDVVGPLGPPNPSIQPWDAFEAAARGRRDLETTQVMPAIAAEPEGAAR